MKVEKKTVIVNYLYYLVFVSHLLWPPLILLQVGEDLNLLLEMFLPQDAIRQHPLHLQLQTVQILHADVLTWWLLKYVEIVGSFCRIDRVEFSEVENGIILRENVTYRNQYQRDLQYYISVESLGNVTMVDGAFNGYVWAVVMKRYYNYNDRQ